MKSGLFGLVTLINLNYDKYFEISVTIKKETKKTLKIPE